MFYGFFTLKLGVFLLNIYENSNFILLSIWAAYNSYRSKTILKKLLVIKVLGKVLRLIFLLPKHFVIIFVSFQLVHKASFGIIKN